MIANNSLPKHWQIKKLGEICEKITKGGTPTTYGFAFVSSGVTFIKIENIDNGKVILPSIKTFISEEAHNYQKKSKLEENDLLFSIAGTIGETCLIKKEYLPANTNQALAILRGYYKEVQPQFLTHQLNSSISQYVKLKARGGAMNNISLEDLKAIELVLPPLPEQQAIVSKIEELFSELDNGMAQLKTAKQQLKVYRQSLLKWAFEGKLTNKNVKEGELPKGWKDVELKGIVERISDGPFGSNLKSIDYVNEGVRVIRLENIGEMEFRNEYKTFVTQEKYETIKRYTVGKGDIIFSSFISESIRSVILPDYIESAINKADCFLVRVSEATVSKKYLAYYFSTKAMQNQLVNQIHGATRPRINTTQLKASKIPFAPLKEQQLIVSELESKLTVCDKIEETISQSLQQAETLRQSILKKAFEGKLIKTKP